MLAFLRDLYQDLHNPQVHRYYKGTAGHAFISWRFTVTSKGIGELDDELDFPWAKKAAPPHTSTSHFSFSKTASYHILGLSTHLQNPQ